MNNNNVSFIFPKNNFYSKVIKGKIISILDIKKKLGFGYYLQYIFRKKNENKFLDLINKFYIKLLSEEHLYHNHLLLFLLFQDKLKKNKIDLNINLTEIYEKL